MFNQRLMTEILGYKPAKLYKAGTRLYIGFYIVDPSTGKLIRRRSYVNHIEDPVLRNRYVSDAIKKINEKLREGWNPCYIITDFCNIFPYYYLKITNFKLKFNPYVIQE